MMTVPFQAKHFYEIDIQDAQKNVRAGVTDNMLKAMEKMDIHTAISGGDILAIYGSHPRENGVGIVCAILSKTACKHMLSLTRLAIKYMNGLSYDKIVADVDCEFTAGHKWAQLTGFKLEQHTAKAYRRDGGNSAIYVRAS